MLVKKVLVLQIICSCMLFLQVLCRAFYPFHLIAASLAVIALFVRKSCHYFNSGWHIYIISLYVYRLFLIWYPVELLILWFFYYLFIFVIAIWAIIVAIKLLFWF